MKSAILMLLLGVARGGLAILTGGCAVKVIACLVVTLSGLTLFTSSSHADWKEGSYMAFAVGAGTYDLGGLNDRVSEIMTPHGFLGFGRGRNDGIGIISAELGIVVTDYFSMGGRFAHRRARHEVLWLGYRINNNEVTGDFSFTAPSPSGVVFGGRAGLSWVTVTEWEEVTEHHLFFSRTYKEDKLSWAATTTVLELYSGLKLHIDDKATPFLRVGYSFRDFGDVAVSGFAPGYDGQDETVVNLDFSGWFVELGFGGILRSD